MPYLVTARKWRPRRFDQVVAQDHITTTLQRAVTSGRIAQCYLFCGPRGCGKTTTARILAKALNCASRTGADPCDECPSCRSIAEGTSMNVLEIDGASNNSVDDVRELREVVRYVPTEGQYKVYIIDEVHMLSTAAFNALLKTLEEPPPHVVFVFATTEVQEVPETILSRCQRFNFRRIPAAEITGHLRTIATAEGVAADDEALFLLASRAEGALRDAESLFDQVLALDPERLTVASVQQVLGLIDGGVYFEATEALAAAEPQRLLELVARVVDSGADIEEFLRGLVEHCRRLFFLRVQGTAAGLDVAESEVSRYEQAAAAFSVEDLMRVLQSLLELQGEVRRSLQPRFRLELTLVRLSLMGRAVQVGELLERLRAFEGRTVPAARPPETAPRRSARPATPTSTAPTTATPAREDPPRRPAPEPAAAPTARAAAGEISLAILAADWDQLVGELRSTQPSLASYLGHARPVAVDGAVLRLAFGPDNRFVMSQVLRTREAVERVCAERWGRSLRIDCVVEEGAARRREETPPEADPSVRAALDTFDGELV